MAHPGVIVFLSAAVLCIFGCSNRAVIKPRSEVVAEARHKGIMMPSADQERRVFFQNEQINSQRVLKLIRDRASGSFREADYRIGAGDEIEINVFDVPELNLSTRVQQSGFISLPLIGGVQAVGLNEAELCQRIRQRLAVYVKSPQVSVHISNYGSQRVAVLGAVSQPGTYPLKKGANSLLELISEAGGLTDRAGSFMNFIPAELSGVGSANDVEARAKLALTSYSVQNRNSGIEIPMDQVLGTTGAIPLEVPVRGGDMIIIPEAGTVMVEGEVDKAGSYELGGRTTLLGALAAAGGITYAAKIDEVEVLRTVDSNRKSHLTVDLEEIATGEEQDIRLRNGDIVRVPSHSGRRLRQDTFDGISRLINVGIGGSVPLR